MRGGGLGQDASWKPGVGEKGEYFVERTMAASPNLDTRYADGLKKGILWGMGDGQPAWTRALGLCKDRGEKTKAAESKTEVTGKIDKALANGLKARGAGRALAPDVLLQRRLLRG